MFWDTHNDNPLNPHIDVVVQPDHDFRPLRENVSHTFTDSRNSHTCCKFLKMTFYGTRSAMFPDERQRNTYDGLYHHPLLTTRHDELLGGGWRGKEFEGWWEVCAGGLQATSRPSSARKQTRGWLSDFAERPCSSDASRLAQNLSSTSVSTTMEVCFYIYYVSV